MGFRQIQIEVELCIERAHDEEIPGRIRPDFFNQLIQGDCLTSPLAHLHGLAIAEQADHLQQQHFQLSRIISESCHGRLDAGYVSMMIGTPDIDHLLKAPFIFVLVIGNIGSQIGWHAVIADDDPVFIVAVIGRFQPERPVFFVGLAPFFQFITGRADGIGMESPFAEPVIIMDIKRSQILPQGLQFFCIGPVLEVRQPFRFCHR